MVEIKNLTCVECPMGCSLKVTVEDGKAISVEGNNCPRGKAYGENEVVCPRRVLTTSLKTDNGKMVAVKTAKPIKKSQLFEVMNKINSFVVKTPVKIGDVIMENVSEDIDLLATSNVE